MTIKERQQDDPVPLLEWIAAALGAVTAIVFLAMIAMSLDDEARDELPELSVEAGRRTIAAGHFSLLVTVRNAGNRSAKQVTVEGKSGEETSSLTLDYVPARSAAEGVLLFKADPRDTDVELRLNGYQLP